MVLLLGFAFLAGIVTILSPCILPILPIILSSTVGGKDTGKARPIGVVTGFVLSFTLFTLFLSQIVQWSGISADTLRLVSVFVIAGFGVSLLVPQFQLAVEKLFSKLARFAPQYANKTGFGSGVLVGLSLGLLWTPCVGPILASVISLAITGTVNFQTFLITLAYSLGTAIPMFAIMAGGQHALQKVPWLLRNTSRIQKAFGVLMILTALAILTNLDRRFQTYILTTFPQYGVGLTQFEDVDAVTDRLKNLGTNTPDKNNVVGKPMFEATPQGPVAPELIPGGEWYNSEPLTLAELKGKVVLVDFWTYSCINCIRTLPYLKDWWSKYKDSGLVIIGVHSPEFEFEKDPENVAKAIQDFGLEYPIVQDNNFDTWRAYSNRYWPAKYLIDKNGTIRYTHFGEGEYEETERIIQELLRETGATNVPEKVNTQTYDIYSRTPELYLGYGRMEYLSSPEQVMTDKSSSYSIPPNIPNNTFAFSGSWQIMEEYSAPQKGSELYLNFEAKEVFLVMRSSVTGEPARVRVYVDDKLQYTGEDVKDGIVTIQKDTLYKLVNLPEPGRHILKLEFLDNNAQIFAFTFG